MPYRLENGDYVMSDGTVEKRDLVDLERTAMRELYPSARTLQPTQMEYVARRHLVALFLDDKLPQSARDTLLSAPWFRDMHESEKGARVREKLLDKGGTDPVLKTPAEWTAERDKADDAEYTRQKLLDKGAHPNMLKPLVHNFIPKAGSITVGKASDPVPEDMIEVEGNIDSYLDMADVPMAATEVMEREKKADKRFRGKMQDILWGGWHVHMDKNKTIKVICEDPEPAPLNAAEAIIVGKERKYIQVSNGLSDMTPLEADKLAVDLTKAADAVRRHNNPNKIRKIGEY